MAISKNLIVTIRNDRAKPEDKMFIYRNDTGVDVYIEISNLGYTVSRSDNKAFITSAKAFYKTPSGNVIQYPKPLDIINGKKIKFSFTNEITPTMQEIGEYELQFQLFDNAGGRVTVPSYYFYVKEPMGQTTLDDNSVVGLAIVGDSIIAVTGEEILFDMENGYIKTEWVSGDLITANRLNNMENGIYTAIEEINAIKENGLGNDGECIYISDVPSTVAVGGIPLNYTTDGITFNDFIYDLLHPYAKPSISLTASPNTSLYEKGYVVPKITFTAKANKGSKNISQIAISKNSAVVELLDFDPTYTENPTIYHVVNNATSNISVSSYVTDGDSRVNSSTININFINPIYIGTVNTETPTQEDIKAMSKRIVNPSNQSYTFTMTNKRMCISVPSNWNIKTIIDPNGFNITGSFSVVNVSVLCLDGVIRAYKTYVSNVNSQTNFTVKFNI